MSRPITPSQGFRPGISRPPWATNVPRGPWAICFSVWKAIFLREALDRFFDVRAAWLWLVLEPAIHIGFIASVFAVIRTRSMGGMDTVVWIVSGMLSFFLFRRTATQVTYAADCNKSLFLHRQVKPFDAAIARAVLEAFLMAVISALVFYVLALSGRSLAFADPLLAMAYLTLLWLFGLGFGLISSILINLVPELEHILKLTMSPLYLLSGTIMPISSVPRPYRDWLLLNPVAHGLEGVRLGVHSQYHPVPGLSLNYLLGSAMLFVGLGLLLYRYFNLRLVTR